MIVEEANGTYFVQVDELARYFERALDQAYALARARAELTIIRDNLRDEIRTQRNDAWPEVVERGEAPKAQYKAPTNYHGRVPTRRGDHEES